MEMLSSVDCQVGIDGCYAKTNCRCDNGTRWRDQDDQKSEGRRRNPVIISPFRSLYINRGPALYGISLNGLHVAVWLYANRVATCSCAGQSLCVNSTVVASPPEYLLSVAMP